MVPFQCQIACFWCSQTHLPSILGRQKGHDHELGAHMPLKCECPPSRISIYEPFYKPSNPYNSHNRTCCGLVAQPSRTLSLVDPVLVPFAARATTPRDGWQLTLAPTCKRSTPRLRGSGTRLRPSVTRNSCILLGWNCLGDQKCLTFRCWDIRLKNFPDPLWISDIAGISLRRWGQALRWE